MFNFFCVVRIFSSKKVIKPFFGHKGQKIDGNWFVAAKVSGVKQKIDFQVASRCSQGNSRIKCGQGALLIHFELVTPSVV